MKTVHVISMIVSAALVSGVAWAQADEPQPGSCEKGPFCRQEGGGFGERMERRERMMDMMGRRGAEQGRAGAGMRGGRDGEEGRGPRGERAFEGGGGQRGRRGGEGFGEKRRGMPDPQQLKAAGVTDKQLESLKALRQEQQLKQIDLKASAEKAELVFDQTMHNETVDAEAALKAADALSQARAALFKAEVANQLKVREILGAEVLKKLHENAPRPGGEGRKGCDACPNNGTVCRRGAGEGGGQPQPPEQK